jgi:hypothetical protein
MHDDLISPEFDCCVRRAVLNMRGACDQWRNLTSKLVAHNYHAKYSYNIIPHSLNLSAVFGINVFNSLLNVSIDTKLQFGRCNIGESQ